MDSKDSEGALPGMELMAGQRVGGDRFELIRCLGRNSTGVVWLAQDHKLREPVSLKFLDAEIQSDSLAVENLKRETQRCRKLSHPNIVRIYDLHEVPGEPVFLSMEYVDGMDLAALRSNGTSEVLSWHQVKPLVEQLCDALDYAHGEQIIHRNLTPGNILIDGQNRLKLADFGIAAFLKEGANQKQMSPDTLAYMSPQQVEGLPSIRDDIYALGVILYELLTSTPPFEKEALLERNPDAKPTPIAERLRQLKIENDVPNEEAAMVMACLSKDPAKRPASARAVAEWVGIEIRRRPKSSIAAPEVKEFTPIQAGPNGPTAEVGEAFGQYKLRRNFLKIGLAVAGVSIASLATGYWWIQHTKTATDTSKSLATPETNAVATSSASSDAVDTSFDAGIGVKGDIRALLVLADGSVLLSGFAVRQEDGKGLSVMHFGPRGTPDSSFAPRIKGNVNAMAQQPDGKLLIAGDFSAIDGEPCNSIARLFPNGKRDSSFNPGEGGDSEILCVSLQPDGKILIGGNFTKFNRLKRVRYARLNSDGSVDEGFNPRTVEAPVWTIVAQPDGKILVGGNFTKLGSIPHTRLVRLHPDSSIDGAFGVNPDDVVRRVVVLPDGEILVGGNFTRFKNQARAGLVRLYPNGKLDESFPPLGDPAAKVRDILVQEDQNIIITGNFSLPSSKGPLNKIARLRKDGILDETLDWGATITGVYQAALTPSGQIIMQGHLTNLFNVPRTNLVRLNLPH